MTASKNVYSDSLANLRETERNIQRLYVNCLPGIVHSIKCTVVNVSI